MKTLAPALLSAGLLSAALFLTPVLPAAPAAAAAPPTCQGRPATLVGHPGQKSLVGTAGADVVVTNGAVSVSTLDGDDVVCITGTTPHAVKAQVGTGPGDDTVDVTAHNPVRAFLDAGDDTFFGRAESDVVIAGFLDYDYTMDDTGVDDIHTGAGPDTVRSGGGGDTVSTGRGYDTLDLNDAFGMTQPARAGRGRDRMFLVGPSGSAVLDNRAGTLTDDGVVDLRWSSVTDFQIYGGIGVILGSDKGETFRTQRNGLVTNGWTVRAGGGNDVMRGTPYADRLLGGAGRDRADGRKGVDRCRAESTRNCEG